MDMAPESTVPSAPSGCPEVPAPPAGRGSRRGARVSGDVWSGRAQLYVESDAHRAGDDLELLVEWARGATTALDVATGGGHRRVRRLRDEGSRS